MTHLPRTKNIAILSNYIPIQCGISTFAKNLYDSITRQKGTGTTVVVAVDDGLPIQDFPPEVAFKISKHQRTDYVRAADFLNSADIDVVCLQHEFGIFGGESGAYILDAIRGLEKPLVVTLHTVLENPSTDQREIMTGIMEKAAQVIVMSQRAVEMLSQIYSVPPEKISMIHHGVPDEFVIREAREPGANLLTFGLLSPDKGIEYAIQAMPAILQHRPDTRYRAVGATHPHIKERFGEAYRESLEDLVAELGLQEEVEFVNRFLSPCEIVEFLDEADVYVTPYLNVEQITSGTLAYAIGGGKAVISTPYWYAAELLTSDRGILVPWRDSDAIAQAAIEVLTNAERMKEIRGNALELGRSMSWFEVGGQYVWLFESLHAAPSPRSLLWDERTYEVPELNLGHLRRLTDETGLLQHAKYSVPRLAEGYCLDDNARALLLTGLVQETFDPPPPDLDDLSSKYLAFVAYALDGNSHRFRNFMSYSGEWMEGVGSEDSQGRALWCLAGFAIRSRNASQAKCAIELFDESMAAVYTWKCPRACAYGLLGLASLRATPFALGDHVTATKYLAAKLAALFRSNAEPGWTWFESYTSYCNARLAHALIAGSHVTQNEEHTEIGIQALSWLWNLQCDREGRFEPLGCNYDYRPGQPKPRFDQQPVEVYATLSACLEAWRTTGNRTWLDRAQRAFDWFFGSNALGVRLFDAESGGCFDGLQEFSVNQNQGAESTLSFLMACEEMRLVSEPALPTKDRVRMM